MKRVFLIALLTAGLGAPVAAQQGQSEVRDGVRYLVPKDEDRQTMPLNIIQSRAVELGFFQWQVPTEKVAVDQVNRPRKVSDCEGHDPEYRPAHDFSSSEDQRTRKVGQAKAFIYDWMAYRNAIENKDCSCGSLRADWSEAVSSFTAMVAGVDNHVLYTNVPSRMESGIENDFERMCDVRMNLDLG